MERRSGVRTVLAACVLSGVFAAGCGGSETANDAGRPSCDEIAAACHALDMGTGIAHDCHEYAEAAGRTEDQCRSRRAECVVMCHGLQAASDAAVDTGVAEQ